ncbi:hypothetical protein PsAD26_01866 [Pseudovibrio sp. Ad26]|nr:hypothetical protein PsAD26_01866 [Pseudovibrio sp. Ad26]
MLIIQRMTVTIVRRPDDPEDPRRREPNAKTADRVIPISDRLATILEGDQPVANLWIGS